MIVQWSSRTTFVLQTAQMRHMSSGISRWLYVFKCRPYTPSHVNDPFNHLSRALKSRDPTSTSSTDSPADITNHPTSSLRAS